MAVELFESSRFETLWAHFEQVLAVPPAAPLARELIVVPASGWENDLSRRLATRFGCWAQYRFLTLGQWLNDTLREHLPDPSRWMRDPEALVWAVAARLPEWLGDDSFAAVRRYLRGDAGGGEPQRLIDLARRIAGLLDQYLLYRPDLIDAWERGADWPDSGGPAPPHAAWQRKLWADLRERLPLRGVQSLIQELAEALAASATRLPERVCVWLAGGVPPAHLDFLATVGRHTRVVVFAISPRLAASGDSAARWAWFRDWRDSGQSSLTKFCEAQQLPPPHPLWESLGDLWRQRQWLLAERDGGAVAGSVVGGGRPTG